jgi:hypothetical protein
VRFLRTLTLFACALGLLGLAGFAIPASPLAVPAAVAGASSLILALG